MEKSKIKNKKAKTPKFRVSFPSVFKPKGFQDQEPKYSLVMLFPKNADLSVLKKAALNAKIEKWGKDQKKWPKNLKSPFRDGDERADQAGYKGTIFVTASSKQKPGLIDRDKETITEESGAFYAGCYAHATVIAFAYEKAGNRGVSFSLQNIQKLADGKPFSGRKAPEEEFDLVEDESDDPENYESADADDESDGYGADALA